MMGNFDYDRQSIMQYGPLQQNFGVTNFDSAMASFHDVPDLTASDLTGSGSTNFSLAETHIQPGRDRSRSDFTGSPSSSYASSIADGRNSISYGQQRFKVPAAMNQDRRFSTPHINYPATQQLPSKPVYGLPVAQPQNEMHGSLWTPNFSFGTPTGQSDHPNQALTEAVYTTAAPQHGSLVERRRGSYGMQPNSQPYRTDRRMSQPVISTNNLMDVYGTKKRRQQSLAEWQPFAEYGNNIATAGLGGSEFRKMSLPMQGMANDMNVLSLQAPEYIPQAVTRRFSVHSIPEQGSIPEHAGLEKIQDTSGIGRFQSFDSSSGSSDESALPFLNQHGANGTPNQASMMTTFTANDNESKHRKHCCTTCGKRFARPSSLQTHMYSHTGAQPFMCEFPGCGRPFSVVSNLRRHKKTHLRKQAAGQESDNTATAMQPAT